MINFTDKNIIESWLKNAKPWITAVRNSEIESRTLVTNKAITDAILQKIPTTALDIGCGEGWLTRELNKAGTSTIGIDVVPELIEAAMQKGEGRFMSLSYENLALGAIKEKFDLIVCNFSLLGNESVNALFQRIPSMLNKKGYFIIQTVHPIVGCGETIYEDGWREGSWAGFNDKFTNPAPWYFRTLETWKALFLLNDFKLSTIIEPLNPKTQKSASIIFIGQKTANNEDLK